jgi:ATP-dependent RNA helicase DDX1
VGGRREEEAASAAAAVAGRPPPPFFLSLPTPIQAEAVPLILGGGDVLAAAETGTGKTGAFALPLLQAVAEARAGVAAAPRTGAGDADRDDDDTAPARLSTVDRDPGLAVAPCGHRAQSRSARAWRGARATHALATGAAYYEATVADDGLCRVGWAAAGAPLELGTGGDAVGFGGTGKAAAGGSFANFGEPYGAGDVVGCGLDAGTGEARFWKNGAPLGAAPTTLDPSAGPYFPSTCLKNAEIALDFAPAAPPAGFASLDAAPGRVGGAAARAAARAAAPPPPAKPAGRAPLALVLEPTKDLAEQTAGVLASLAARMAPPGVVTALLVGGAPPAEARAALAAGVDVVVGTLGRVAAAAEAGEIDLTSIRLFVLDEADRLLADAGGEDAVTTLHGRCGGGAGVQIVLVSATLDAPSVDRAASLLCSHPAHVDLRGRGFVPTGVDHVRADVDPRADRSWMQAAPEVPTDGAHALLPPAAPGSETPDHWSEAVKKLKPRLLLRLADALAMDACVVFCRTNHDCDQLERFLRAASDAAAGGAGSVQVEGDAPPVAKYGAVVLAGARSLDERRAALAAFRSGAARFLIATDVGARGLDVDSLPYCVNMTLPPADEAESYIHRVGRVGRAGRRGLAISLVSAVPERVWYCTKKGYKPWLAPGARDAALVDEGGHTVWFDERASLAAVQARLGAPVRCLAPDLALPPDIAAAAAAGAAGGGYGGGGDGGAGDEELRVRLAQLAPAVAELASLEARAQDSFFALQRRWSKA